ncbi:hypothetical protein RR48_00039 [Papilio machaon]|uniref:Uncharacterized protein n=1 Tax=Papilio machaon TaxID=76193 RepID=A0A0N1PKD7_PAPMA|nr:hypothetical protein RR48_00039 [Papilio machaon]
MTSARDVCRRLTGIRVGVGVVYDTYAAVVQVSRRSRQTCGRGECLARTAREVERRERTQRGELHPAPAQHHNARRR